VKFARLGPIGQEIPVIVEGDSFYDLRPVTEDITGDFLSRLDIESLKKSLAEGAFSAIADAGSWRVGAPVARPSAVYCVGLNYAAHAKESGATPPEYPVIFLKPPNTLVGPNDDVTIPKASEKTDWEVELAIVIGSRTSYLDSPEEALDHVAGFAVANDLSERTFQLELSGGQWSKGKAAPGFTPLGPWLVTPGEVDHHNLRLRSFVNGEPRQDSHTSDMIFGVEHIVWHLSQFLAFEPGDVILTGTPEGVALSGKYPYLQDSDVVEIDIEGLGRQRHTMHAYAKGKS
jgi:2-keto-4-pentenoate hydratase/2-oxohepta-3-ene-1,7-dioic acid hydratase in catechol pathway